MARVTLKVTSLNEKAIFRLPSCKAALTKEANSIAAKANAMSANFRTGLFYPNNDYSAEPLENVGNKQPKYKGIPAKVTNKGSMALVVEGNYAAIKDNHLHNTLKKAGGV